MAIASATLLVASGCGGIETGSNETGTTGDNQAQASAISRSTGLRITAGPLMEDLKGNYPLCVLLAAKSDRVGHAVHVVAIPLQPEDAASILSNQFTSEERAEKRYPTISLGANRAISLALSGADHAVFENGSAVGVVADDTDNPPYYVVIVDRRWFVSLLVPDGYLTERLVEPLARDVVASIEAGEISCR